VSEYRIGDIVTLTGKDWGPEGSWGYNMLGKVVSINEVDDDEGVEAAFVDPDDGTSYEIYENDESDFSVTKGKVSETRTIHAEELMSVLAKVVDQKTGKPELVGNSVMVKNPCANCGHDWAAHWQPGDPTPDHIAGVAPMCRIGDEEAYRAGLATYKWCACSKYVQRYVLESLVKSD
jgi:hypothetical protein